MTQKGIQNMTPLFEEVQLTGVFPDGKTFVDCLPRFTIEEINTKYLQQKDQPAFNLKEFVLANFDLPVPHSNGYSSDLNKTVEENIETLWTVLTRQPDKTGGSLIPLPYPYIVPGGRFGEIYYWDSYFAMLGLEISGKNEMLENMINNFSYLIDTFGYIPNGNRSYFIGRSQPPFYSLMVKLLADINGEEVLITCLPQLEKEYNFWMKGAEELSEANKALHRTVRMPDREILNRYWDENDTARPESYREDVELSHQSEQEPKKLFRHLRAGAESGWDYSSRWFKDVHSFARIHSTDIIPVDLNCLLFHSEQTIAEAYRLKGNTEAAKQYQLLAEKRKTAIQKYCWNNKAGFYFDYDAEEWDAPNGWAPLQWITITGLENYGHHELAAGIARRWIRLNTEVFKRTGKLMEKYNVMDTHLEAGGGEYPGQDGFGWTNGVFLALIKKYGPAN
jgi:alpha,alpha-trehalase